MYTPELDFGVGPYRFFSRESHQLIVITLRRTRQQGASRQCIAFSWGFDGKIVLVVWYQFVALFLIFITLRILYYKFSTCLKEKRPTFKLRNAGCLLISIYLVSFLFIWRPTIILVSMSFLVLLSNSTLDSSNITKSSAYVNRVISSSTSISQLFCVLLMTFSSAIFNGRQSNFNLV